MIGAVRGLSLAISLLCVAAVALGWMPGQQLAPSVDCGWLPVKWTGAACAHDDGLRATIGWGLTIPLVLGALVAGQLVRRPRLEAAAVWSAVTLALAGLYLAVRWDLVGFHLASGTALWPRAAFGHVVRAIGGLHVALLVLPAIAWARRRARPTLPPASVIRR